LDTIPSRDVVEYPETLAPDFIIPPAATTVTAVRGVRVGLRCKRLDYDVTPLEREVAIGVTVGHEVIPDYGDAPAGWTPAALSLTAWYDAGTPSDFTLDTGSVSQWNDRSGNSRHMSQSTGSAKPAYASATQNSLNLVTFDGTNDYLAASALSNFITASTFTIFAVVRHRGTSVGNSDTYNNRAIIADDAGYVGLHTNGPSGTGSIRILAYNWDGTDDSVSHTIGADNVWSIIAYTHSGGSIESRRNGGAAVSVSSGDTEDIAGILELGRAGVVGLYLEMDLAEVVIMNTAVNSTDRQKLEGYAAHRWGLTADLPSDHPYKSTAP
jgi:hypothetical protein